MGMVVQLRRGPETIISNMQENDEAALDFVIPEDDKAYEDGTIIDTDKTWHAIHFLLTGTADLTELPAGFLLGGTEVGVDNGYGPARYLTASQVKQVADFFETLPEDFIQDRLDFKALQRHDIYPSIWDRADSEDIEYVEEYFSELRAFVKTASRHREAVVMVVT